MGLIRELTTNAPQTGNPVVITFTGPATGDLTVGVLIHDETAGAPPGGRWVGATAAIKDVETADEVATKIAADFTARNWDGWVSAVAVGATVTFTPQAAGTATGYVLYAPASSVRALGADPTPVPVPGGDFVKGPSKTKGHTYWIQREAGMWYVWFDVDPDPTTPDVRFALEAFLDDPAHDEVSPAIRRKARNFGYEG